ncbi:hypothetical protein [Pseudomonas sp. S3_H04]
MLIIKVGVVIFQQAAGVTADAVVPGAGEGGGIAFLVVVDAVGIVVAKLRVTGADIDLVVGTFSAEGVEPPTRLLLSLSLMPSTAVDSVRSHLRYSASSLRRWRSVNSMMLSARTRWAVFEASESS